MHDPAVNPSRVTVPQSGLYVVTGWLQYASNATGNRWVMIQKNGAQVQSIVVPGHGNTAAVVITVQVEATANDYFEVAAQQTSGANLDCQAANLAVVKVASMS